MKTIEEKIFGDVLAVKLGFSFVGKPYMSVFCYIVNGIMVDTGQAHIGSSLINFLEDKKVERVILTHHHEDHSGNAALIKETYKLPIFGSKMTVAKMKKAYKILPYQHLMFGSTTPLEMNEIPDCIEGENIKLKPFSTPGHSKDHTVYFDSNRGVIFSGDLFIGEKIRYFRVDEDIDQTISSLEKVLKLDFDVVFCGHRPHYENGRKLMAKKLEYLLNFRGEVENLHSKGYSERIILKKMDIREVHRIKLMTFGNVSLFNMIKSTVKNIKSEAYSKENKNAT